MSRPEVWYFVHLISKLLPVIAVVHHQADVLHLETEGTGDLVHQSKRDTHNSTSYSCQDYHNDKMKNITYNTYLGESRIVCLVALLCSRDRI